MTGTLTISFDFEIGWGDVTNERWREREARGTYEKIRETLPQLLDSLDRHDAPATWATVGAMIDDPASRTLDHLPPAARALVEGVITEADATSFDGKDLFDMVVERRRHDIACHSYSHVPFDFDGVDEEFVKADLQAFHEVLSRFGLETDRLVFPENTARQWESVAASGFTRARVDPNHRFESRPMRLADSLVLAPPMEDIGPSAADGVEAVAGSMLFNSGHGRRHRLPFVYRRALLGLEHAANRGQTLHVWAHPFNFVESPGLLEAFDRFLGRAAELRKSGRLEIRPM